MFVHARFALAYVALHALIRDHHDRGVKLSRPLAVPGATSETLEPRLSYLFDCGRSGPRNVFSSRMLYRKNSDK